MATASGFTDTVLPFFFPEAPLCSETCDEWIEPDVDAIGQSKGLYTKLKSLTILRDPAAEKIH